MAAAVENSIKRTCEAPPSCISAMLLRTDDNGAFGLDDIGQFATVTVRFCQNRRQADQYALTLMAMNVRSTIIHDGMVFNVKVAPEDAPQALRELSAQDKENLTRKTIKKQRRYPPLFRWDVALVFWAVLLFFFVVSNHQSVPIDWIKGGTAQAGLMFQGEWWRAITALTLHANAAHLFGNLVFGTFFLLLLTQIIGAGLAAITMITAGAAGNIMNALVHSSAHTSIGASTAVFAALGILAAIQVVERSSYALSTLRKLTPVAGGLGLLAFLGFSGERTDILAHVAGFAMGLAMGLMLARSNRDWIVEQDLQLKCFYYSLAIVFGAWIPVIAF